MSEPQRTRYVALFAAESRSLLAGGRRTLTTWFNQPAESGPAEEIFRVLHTIKGMAGSLGFETLVEAVHGAEEGLDEVRRGARAVDRPWLLGLERTLDDLALHCERMVDAEAASAEPDARGTADSASRDAVVRVDLTRLDALLDDLGALLTARQELERHAATDGFSPMARSAVAMARRLDALQDRILHVRLAPLAEVFERLPPMVRDLARQLGKDVSVEVTGENLEVDRAILALLPEPVLHLLRNAVDHGIETPEARREAGKRPTGRITIQARRDRDSVVVELSDDGRGIDHEAVVARARKLGLLEVEAEVAPDALLGLLAKPGFSTASSVTEVSGRGVGLDAVVARLHGVGASVSLTTVAGKGTVFAIRLPTRLGIVRTLVAAVGDERYVVPLTHVAELVAWEPQLARQEGGRSVLEIRGDAVPVVDLRRLLQYRGSAPPERRPAVIVESQGERVALLADQVHGQLDAVVQPIDRPAGMPRWITGATVLGDGRPALMLDLASVV
jgi:two-component system chemotaxis sensor kinase CheA